MVAGIGIGIILSNVENQENVVCVALQGMAAGTLLYVVFFEVLARERDNNHSGVWQLLAILVGFMFMFTLQTFSEYSSNKDSVCVKTLGRSAKKSIVAIT